ncbi:MAG: hypothetical protein FJ382_04955 [Verrucomicrobia bacterium]|nr:hypothetical protein [Verrucomicrobiota bacterium]
MPIPDYQSCMLPLLRFASDGAEHPLKDAIEALSAEFRLTDQEKMVGWCTGRSHTGDYFTTR